MRFRIPIFVALAAAQLTAASAQTSRDKPRPPQQERVAAAPTFSADAQARFAITAIDLGTRIEGSTPVVSATLRLADFQQILPELQRGGLINPELTQVQKNRMRFSIASTFLTGSMALAIKEIYQDNPGLNTARFEGVIEFDDAYGNSTKETIYTFEFTRDLYSRINWARFDYTNLSTVSRSFRMTPFYRQKLNEELG
jgi:hypothetical protein